MFGSPFGGVLLLEPTERFSLSENQGKIIEALIRIQEEYSLAEIYQGALKIHSNPEFGDRHAFAAHGFRELIEKLSLTASTIAVTTNDLNEKVKKLRLEYGKIDPVSESCPQCNKLFHNEKSTTFLEKVGFFFHWFDRKPSARDRYRDLMQKLEPSEILLPKEIVDTGVAEFQRLYGYFATISHHNKNADIKYFDEKVATLERVLMNQFYPPTFQKHEEIDKIISEAETDDL